MTRRTLAKLTGGRGAWLVWAVTIVLMVAWVPIVRLARTPEGFATSSTSYGTGLQGMADRLDAIRGTLAVESSPGGGTTITGRVPAQVLETA